MFPNIKIIFQFHFKLNRASPNSWCNRWGTCLISREIRNIFIQTTLKWLLSHNHIIAEMTGRGLTTVQCITQLVCKVIVTNLWSNFVFFVMFSSLFEAAIFSLWLTFRTTGTRKLVVIAGYFLWLTPNFVPIAVSPSSYKQKMSWGRGWLTFRYLT